MEKTKNSRKIITALVTSMLLMLLIVFSFAGCAKSDVTGTYKVKMVYSGYDEKIYYVGDMLHNEEKLFEDLIVAKVNSDNTLEVTIKDGSNTHIYKGVWYECEEGKIQIKTSDVSGICYFSNNMFILEDDDITIFLSK